MSWLRRHARWAGSVALLAVLVLLIVVRLGSEWGDRTPAPANADSGGVVAGQPDSLTLTAQHIRLLQDEVMRTRERLAALQTDSSVRRDRIAALDEMLAADCLTPCPDFLREETTVRALQKIIREAADSAGPPTTVQTPLHTAATVARERLRTKFQVLRGQLVQEINALETQADSLRNSLHLQTDELERLQRQANRQLQSDRLRSK